MARQSLAIKYRPQKWEDVVGQGSSTTILRQQLDSGEIKHAYLFCGGAGTGKTTCARIFANEINKGHGNPTELDAASNNSVDDIRNIIQQAKVQSMDSEYRVFILDEVHALSNNAWQAMLKILEEPPKKSIFIMCTTDPQKIPKTILSRVQRFDFQRISQKGIFDRLTYIMNNEPLDDKRGIVTEYKALEYIAKLADGGMRDAITMLDKCLAYSEELTMDNVITALGTVDYEVFFELTDALHTKNGAYVIKVIETVHSNGKDLKLFMKEYLSFLLDMSKYDITHSFEFLQIPNMYETPMNNYEHGWYETVDRLLGVILQLLSEIKWETKPKTLIEARLLLEVSRGA